MSIEKLTEEQRLAVQTHVSSGPKALRIIDQLTAALEVAEHEVDEGKTFAAETGLEIGGLRRELKLVSALRDSFAAGMASAESRAEALQVEVTRLTAALEAADARAESLQDARAKDSDARRRWESAVEARAEALQARVAELEARHDKVSRGLHDCVKERVAAEAELTTAKARVAELETENRELSRRPTLECARQTESELADLRGRVERALVEWERVKRHYQVPMHLCVALELLRGR